MLVPGGACHASHHGVKQPFAPPRGPRSDVGTSSTPPHLPVTHPPCTATTNPPTCQVARCVDVAAPPRRAMAVGTACGQGRAAIWVGGGVLQLYKCPHGLDRSCIVPSRARATATTNPSTYQVARCVDVAAPPRRAMAVGTWPRDGCRYPAAQWLSVPRAGKDAPRYGLGGGFYSSTSALMA